MNSKIILALAISIVTLFSSCKKNEDGDVNAYFYTTMDTAQVILELYIDGQPLGKLPYLSSRPTCAQVQQENRMPMRNLKYGKYTFIAKDAGGNVVSESTYKIGKGSTSAGGGKGGSESFMTDDCLVVNLYY